MVFFVFLDISNGDVSLYWNNQLCFEDTINWDDILTGEGATVYTREMKNKKDYVRKCEKIIRFRI